MTWGAVLVGRVLLGLVLVVVLTLGLGGLALAAATSAQTGRSPWCCASSPRWRPRILGGALCVGVRRPDAGVRGAGVGSLGSRWRSVALGVLAVIAASNLAIAYPGLTGMGPQLSAYPRMALAKQQRAVGTERIVTGLDVGVLILGDDTPAGLAARAHPELFVPQFRCPSAPCTVYLRC